MAIEDNLQILVSDLRDTLDKRLNQLRCFCDKGVQVEGWLKGEMLYFLDNEVRKNVIKGFDREVWIWHNDNYDKRSVIDLRIDLKDSSRSVFVELKHWLIGKQRGVMWRAFSYFSDPSSVGISLDVKKLKRLSKETNYTLILATANPGHDDWVKGIEKFNSKFAPLRVESLTEPNNFPEEYFIGLLKIA